MVIELINFLRQNIIHLQHNIKTKNKRLINEEKFQRQNLSLIENELLVIIKNRF